MTRTRSQHTIEVKLTIAEARALSFVARQNFPGKHYQAVLSDGRTLNEGTYAAERERGYAAMLKLERAIEKQINKLKRHASQKGTVNHDEKNKHSQDQDTSAAETARTRSRQSSADD